MNRFLGASQVALQPETSAQVSQILKHCNDRRIAVVPQVRIVKPDKQVHLAMANSGHKAFLHPSILLCRQATLGSAVGAFQSMTKLCC